MSNYHKFVSQSRQHKDQKVCPKQFMIKNKIQESIIEKSQLAVHSAL
jgi:hypothetical protein